ncbi:MAG: hypothetical protein F4Y50_02640, partial [Dehalococcoidia bacterium]|nr:hypothetical protein [Dehalococcoidia bacterium]
AIAMDDLERIMISVSDQGSGEMRDEVVRQRSNSRVISTIPVEWDIAGAGRDVTDEFIIGPPGWEVDTEQVHPSEARPPVDTREVFVVHGRNEKARKAIFEFLRSLDLRPLEWAEFIQQTGKGSPYVGEILDAAFARAHAIVVLFTPDDEVRLKEQFRVNSDPSHESEWTGQARPNVLFEAGMALAQNQDRTILIELGILRPVSDLAGRHTIRIDDTSEKRKALAQRLATAGCPINLDGDDWLTSGDFDAALAESLQTSSQSVVIAGQQSTAVEFLQRLSEEAKQLLQEAARDSAGTIAKVRTAGGMSIQTNGKEFVERRNAREEATWIGTLNDLVSCGFVNDETGKGQVFWVTDKGFEAADSIESK